MSDILHGLRDNPGGGLRVACESGHKAHSDGHVVQLATPQAPISCGDCIKAGGVPAFSATPAAREEAHPATAQAEPAEHHEPAPAG